MSSCMRISIHLAAVVDSVNVNDAWGIQVKQHAPFPDATAIEARAIGQRLYISFADLAIPCQGKQDAHCGLAVDAAEIITGGWLPDKLLHKPYSRRISSCGMPREGFARAASMRASISGSTGAS